MCLQPLQIGLEGASLVASEFIPGTQRASYVVTQNLLSATGGYSSANTDCCHVDTHLQFLHARLKYLIL